MDKLSKTSLNYYLSEYLADLKRAGVQELWRGDSVSPAIERRPNSQPDASPPSSDVLSAPALTLVNSPRDATPSDSGATRAERLRAIAAEVAKCSLCPALVANRSQTVFGTGSPSSELVFIGEGPGAEEDLRGEPFVGRSGKLLTDMIEKGMGLSRADVFICNIVRCRPPGNRNPTDDEARACRPFLDATLDVIRPKYICCLGAIAATSLLGVNLPIGRLRGKAHEHNGALAVCTYHPAYLLRNPSAKKDAWQDLQLLMGIMGLELPPKRQRE